MVLEDTTTHSFYGLYENEDGSCRVGIVGAESGDPVEVVVTHGYSKDNRVECKQVLQELLVSSDGDVPLMFKAWSRNESDVTVMRERIRELKEALKRSGAEDLCPEHFIADSELYSEATLRDASKDGSFWITRVPDTVSRTSECIGDAIRGKKFWNHADHISKGLSWQSFTLTHFDVEQRFIVVRTGASKARTSAGLERRVEKEAESLAASIRKFSKQRFACVPDLEKAWRELFAKALYHAPGTVEVASESRDRKRGRPRKGDESEFLFFAQKGKACKDTESIRKRELEGACFVIATNDLRPETSSEDILRYYMKGQQGVERAFRFLKDPLYFADAFFLKSPARIAALLCVMTIDWPWKRDAPKGLQ